MNKHLEESVRILKKGGIIIFPTDTAFGIGCRIDREDSVRRLYKIRKRPGNKAVPVLVSSIKMAQNHVEGLNSNTLKFIKKYWPGGLTLIFNSKPNVSELVRGGGKTLGVRMPKQKTTVELVRRVGVPILAPSANFSGEKTPFSVSELDPSLVRMVDFVLSGRTSIKKPSTVFDISKKPWKVLREGAVKVEL